MIEGRQGDPPLVAGTAGFYGRESRVTLTERGGRGGDVAGDVPGAGGGLGDVAAHLAGGGGLFLDGRGDRGGVVVDLGDDVSDVADRRDRRVGVGLDGGDPLADVLGGPCRLLG